MSIELVTLLFFGGMVLLLAMGVPVVFALGGISIAFTVLLEDDLFIVATTTYGQTTHPGLITIPLFLLMGNFLLHSGISDRLFQALNYWLSGLSGGLAIGRLYDSDGTTLLNTVSHDYLSDQAGGVAIRAFGGIYADTVTVCW